MASVDGRHSLMFSSDSIPMYQCGPCKSEDKISEAKHLCQVCNDYLCDMCKRHHKKFKDLKGHKIVPVKGSDIPGVKCNCNQAFVEFFCEEHNDVLCGSCQMIKHRTCTISTFREKATPSKGLQKGHVLPQAKQLAGMLENIEFKKQVEKKNVAKFKSECKADIEASHKQLISLLDGKKENLLKTLDSMYEKQITEIETQLSSLTTSMTMLKAGCKCLEDIQKSGNNEAIFAAEIKVSNNLSDFDTVLLDMQREPKTLSVCFESNTSLEKMVRDSSLGNLKTHKGQGSGTINRKDNAVIVDKMVSKKTEVQLKSHTNRPDISGVSFMRNGKLLLADFKNIKVELLSKYFAHEDSLELSSHPWNITAFDDHTGIVSLPSECKLLYIYMTPHLSKGRTISSDKPCWSVKQLADELFLTCGCGGEGEIRVLDINGTVRRQIGVNRDGSSMVGGPHYLAVCSDSRKIYLSDRVQKTIYCFTYDGHILFQYRNDMEAPYGLYVDDEDNVLVCGDNDVDVITAHGIKHTTLLSSKDGLDDICLDYRPSDRTLVLGSDNGNLHVFKLAEAS